MATVMREVVLNLPADEVWDCVRAVDKAHELFAGVLVDGEIEGDLRTVTFAGGMVAKERIVGVDEAQMRVAYSVVEGPFSLHAASMQVVADGPLRSRVTWFSDFKPDALTEMVTPLMEAGLAAMKRNLEDARAD